MFTGIVEAVGSVAHVEPRGAVRRTAVRCPEIMDDVRLGDSIAIDGVCQTVVARDANSFQFDSVPETLSLTTIGSWEPGRPVNVERSLKVGARLGGHWVLGHVDGLVHLVERRDAGESSILRFDLPDELAPQVAHKGSVAIDGISLTAARVQPGWFEVAVIPFTLAHTTLGGRRPGDPLHIETDVLAKYIGRLRESSASERTGLTASLLERAGFLTDRT